MDVILLSFGGVLNEFWHYEDKSLVELLTYDSFYIGNDKYKPGIRINRQSHTDEDCVGKEDAIRELKKEISRRNLT